MSSSNPTPHITLSILKNYYPFVVDLRAYFSHVLQPSNLDHVRLSSPESVSYTCLLDTAYVASSQPLNKSFSYVLPDFDMREVIDQAQVRLFRSKNTQNILTLGYRLAFHATDRGRKGITRIGITNTFVNTMITAIQAPEWEKLLHHIGIDAMLHLLTETSVFQSLPNGCLCQVTGVPIIFLTPSVQNNRTLFSLQLCEDSGITSNKKRSFTAVGQEERPCKRRKLANSESSRSSLKLLKTAGPTPADIFIVRNRIFYSRPAFIPHTNRILVGLPLKHVLNRLQPSFDANTNRDHIATDTRKQAEQVRHLSKYVFARQYGLVTPFHPTTVKGASFNFPYYLDREAEIKAIAPCKTPKRLKDIFPLLEKLLKRHHKCRYVPLRDRVCSSKVKSAGNQDMDSRVILELMSEHSIQLRSQASLGAGNTSVDSSGNPIPPSSLTQAQKHAKYNPRFIEFACTHTEVHRYVVLVTNAVIPKSFWGTKSNLKLVSRTVKQFISCRRYESLSLHTLLQGFSTLGCDWLIPPGPGARVQARISVSDSLKRRELLEDFLFWYFDSFVLPLLKTTFYVTESSASRNQVLYFRHDDWTVLCAPLITRLTSVTFEKLTDAEAAEIFRQRRLGFSYVRLLPKETGVRPIVNLRRKKLIRGSHIPEQSINQILQAAFKILSYERNNQPHLLGASVLGPDDVYKKLKGFKANLPRDSKGRLPSLYFVKVDVQTCFDTIDQTKLLQILRELISEDLYMMQKYGQIDMCLGKSKRTFVKKAVPQDDHPHFLRYATDLAKVLRNTIFVDQVIYPVSKKQEILQLLEEHITENIVKIGQSYYRQMVGIPQGSVLSSILCSFFYGDLEKKFSSFTEDPCSAVLLRLIDDYLFITTDLTKAKRFLDIMKKGHPEYGCFISQDKTLTNFDHDGQLLNVVDPSQKTFPWCGYTINMKDLSIMVDYSRYNNRGVKSTLTVRGGRHPGATFTYKLLQMAKAKSHAIFSDKDLNTEYVVYLNIYQNSLMTALKTHEYLRTWSVNKRRNNTFLCDAIRRAVTYNYISIRAQSRKKGCVHNVHRDAVLWLGNHAFHHILSRKPQGYASLLAYLQFELNRSKHRHRYHRKFKSLIKEGQTTFTQFVI